MTPEQLLELVADQYPDPPFAVAVSGGPDSAVALWAGVRIGGDAAVVAIHVDHGWAASQQMADAARSVADHVGLELGVHGLGRGQRPPASETGARAFRLAGLSERAQGLPVVTGHHRDDDVETVLGNLLRGAGAAGLSGIPSRRSGFYRPLLGIDRADIRSVADTLGLPYALDPSNEDTTHRRNRIRHVLLPMLEAAEPGVSDRLLRTAAALRRDDAILEAVAADVTIRTDPFDHAILVPHGALRTAPPPVAARIVRRALRLAHAPYPGTAADVAAVLEMGERPSVSLSEGVDAVVDGPYLAFVSRDRTLEIPPPISLPVPGEVQFAAHRLEARPTSAPDPWSIGRSTVFLQDTADLIVRAPQEGDRIDITGGSKLVSDALSEARIPLRRRHVWPVVESRGRIVWLARVRVAYSAAQGAGSGEGVKLVAERL